MTGGTDCLRLTSGYYTVSFNQLAGTGYKIHTIDSTWHRMLGKRKGESEIYCQFEEGRTQVRRVPYSLASYWRHLAISRPT